MNRRSPLLRWLGIAPSLLAASAGALAMPGGFEWAPGNANALPLQALAVERIPGRMLPWPSSALLHDEAQPPTYWVAAGLGVPRHGIADHPLAAAWRVEATPACARLVSVPMADVKAPGVRVVQHNELLPMTCASGFADDCTSTDGLLRINITFAGKQRVRTVRGGFFGSEGPIQQALYTGTRMLAITDRPSGRSVQLTERLRDTPACIAPQTDIRYLPGLRRVLLLGVVLEGGVPGAHCVALPEAAAAAAR